VEAVHEFEGERDQQRDPKQHERGDRQRLRAGPVDVGDQAIQGETDAGPGCVKTPSPLQRQIC
jgi:hypothetical protein